MEAEEAVRRCLAGDKEAFSAVVRQFQGQILAYCLRLTGNREDAADAAQQTFVNCYRHLPQYNPAKPLRPWLYRIATNACIALRRTRPPELPADADTVASVPDPGVGAPSLVELAADRERVRQAVARLPDVYRHPVVLYYFGELGYTEIARQTGVAVTTVGTHLYRAKQLLKEMLASEEGSKDGAHCDENAAKVPERRRRPG